MAKARAKTAQAKRCADGTYSLVIGGKVKKTGFASIPEVKGYLKGLGGFKAKNPKPARKHAATKRKRVVRKGSKVAWSTGRRKRPFLIENPKARKRAKRKNPITKTRVKEFDVAMNSKAHGWVIVDFGYGDRESAADAAKSYRAEEKRPTKVLMRSKLESPETSAAFLKLKGSAKNPKPDMQAAFDAGKRWITSGAADESGVANARVSAYGFSKWWNNLPPSMSQGKTQAKKAFMEGIAAGKRVERGYSKKNPPYRRYGSGEHRVIHRTTGPRHFGSLHHFEKEEDAKKFAKDAKGIYTGKRKTAKKNPKRKRNVPAAFRAAAKKAKAMSPAQRAAWAKKMQLARKRAAAKRKR